MAERAPRVRVDRDRGRAAEQRPAAAAMTIAARRSLSALAGSAERQQRAAVRSGTIATDAQRGAAQQGAGRRRTAQQEGRRRVEKQADRHGAAARQSGRRDGESLRRRREQFDRRRAVAAAAEAASQAGTPEVAERAGAARAGTAADAASAAARRAAEVGPAAVAEEHAAGTGARATEGPGGGAADGDAAVPVRRVGPGAEAAHSGSAKEASGSDVAGPAHQEFEVAHEVAHEATEAQRERTPDVAAERDPLAPYAQRLGGLVNADAATASALVVGRAAARRAGISAQFAARRTQVTGVVQGASERIGSAVRGTAQRITLFVSERLLAIQTRITDTITRVTSVITTVAASLRTAADAVLAAVTGLVNGAVERVMDFAESLPIPDLPLIRRVRGVVLGAARRIASVITGVVTDVSAFAASIVGFVLSGITGLAMQFGAMLYVVVAQIAAAVLNVIATIQAQLAALRARLAAALTAGLRAMMWMLIFAERAAIGQIDRMERSTLQRIEVNRRRALAQLAAVLAFVVGGPDYPSDDGTWGPLDALDSAATKAVADAGALAAFAAVSEAARAHNAVVVARFELQTSTLVSLAFRGAADFARDISARIAGAVREVITAVAGVAAGIVLTVRGYVTSVISQVVALAQLISGHVRRILDVFRTLIGNPLAALRSVLIVVISVVRGFVTRLIDGLIAFFRRGMGSDDAATQGVTSGLEAFAPARLAAAAGMASVPLAIGVIIAEAAGATLAILGVILYWTAIAGIIVLSLYALYRLVMWIISRVQAKPIVRRIPKEKAPPKDRQKRRRRRRARKPFFWNPRATSDRAVASGGLHGALDVRLIRDLSTPHGHHVWPKYVGGPEVQPMLGARLRAHQALHVQFPAVMGPAAASLAPPPTALTPTTVGNLPLIVKLRNNDAALTQFAAALTGFYLMFNAQVEPRMPAAAYLPGIATAMAVIRSWRRRGR